MESNDVAHSSIFHFIAKPASALFYPAEFPCNTVPVSLVQMQTFKKGPIHNKLS